MGWLGIAGLVALLAAGMILWSAKGDDAKAAGPAPQVIEYEVVSVHQSQRKGDNSYIVTIRFRDPFTGAAAENGVYIQTAYRDRYQVGQKGRGLTAPQWSRPTLDETPPDLAAQASAQRSLAMGLGAVGLVLLAIAWKTGNLLPGR